MFFYPETQHFASLVICFHCYNYHMKLCPHCYNDLKYSLMLLETLKKCDISLFLFIYQESLNEIQLNSLETLRNFKQCKLLKL